MSLGLGAVGGLGGEKIPGKKQVGMGVRYLGCRVLNRCRRKSVGSLKGYVLSESCDKI